MKYLIRFIFITVIGLSYAYSVNAQPSASHDLVLTVEAWSSIDLSNTQVDMSLNNDDVTSVTDNSTQLTWGTNSTSTQKIVVSSDIDPYVISVQATNFGPDGTAGTGSSAGTAIPTPVVVNMTGNDFVNGITQGGGHATLAYDFSTATKYEAPATKTVDVTYQLTADN